MMAISMDMMDSCPKHLPKEASRKRHWGRPGTYCRYYISYVAWEFLLPLEEVAGKNIWASLLKVLPLWPDKQLEDRWKDNSPLPQIHVFGQWKVYLEGTRDKPNPPCCPFSRLYQDQISHQKSSVSNHIILRIFMVRCPEQSKIEAEWD